VADGLGKGLYERVGGIVRDTASQEVVAWLREAVESGAPLSADVLTAAAAPNAAVLNLALTGMGFAVVMKRLDAIQRRLREAQQLLEAIDYKIDLSFYANFRAAIDLAANSASVANSEARRGSLLQAIGRFLEAEHHYKDLVDIELANQSQAADDYLVTLCLAYVTEAWCYLKLDEVEAAELRLQEGQRIVRPRFERHVRTLLTSNPAAYLHPSVQPAIGLGRFARVFNWLTPGATENTVFDAQRQNLFDLARQPQAWVDSLPQAIGLPVKSRFFGQKALADLSRQLNPREMTRRFAGLVGAFNPAAKTTVEKLQPSAEDPSEADAVFGRLPGIFSQIEGMIEHCSRFESYLAEVHAMRELGFGLEQWQNVVPAGVQRGTQSQTICIRVPPRGAWASRQSA
jgi:hypothetical protein